MVGDASAWLGRGGYTLHPGTLRAWARIDDRLFLVDPLTSTQRPLSDPRLPERAFSAAFSDDGALLAYPAGQLDQTEILVWDAEHAKLLHTLTGPRDTVFRMAFSPDNRRLVAVGSPGTDSAPGIPFSCSSPTNPDYS